MDIRNQGEVGNVPIHEPPKEVGTPEPSQPPIPVSEIEVVPPRRDQLPPEHNDHEGLKSLLSTFAIIILAPLIAFTLTAFVFQSYEVDGSSMETTLQNQDRLIVLKVPKTLAKITNHTYIPHRGDVIIFNKNNLEEFGGSGKKQLVKRVIGLPGDHIMISNGKINITNASHPNGFDPDITLPYGSGSTGPSHNTSCGGAYCDLTIQPGQVFVCGDNRDNSLDSRIFGPISVNDIVGKLTLRIYPFSKFEIF